MPEESFVNARLLAIEPEFASFPSLAPLPSPPSSYDFRGYGQRDRENLLDRMVSFCIPFSRYRYLVIRLQECSVFIRDPLPLVSDSDSADSNELARTDFSPLFVPRNENVVNRCRVSLRDYSKDFSRTVSTLSSLTLFVPYTRCSIRL